MAIEYCKYMDQRDMQYLGTKVLEYLLQVFQYLQYCNVNNPELSLLYIICITHTAYQCDCENHKCCFKKPSIQQDNNMNEDKIINIISIKLSSSLSQKNN